MPDYYNITLTKVEGKEGTFKNTARGPYFLLTDDGWRTFDEDPREYKWTDKTVCLYQGTPGDDDDDDDNGEGDGKGVNLDDACGRRLVRMETHRWAFVALPSGHSDPPAKSEDGGEKGVTDPPRVEEWHVETWGRYKAARDGFTEGVYRLTCPESQKQPLNVHSGDNPNVPYRFDSLLRDLSTRTENELLQAAHGPRAVSSFCRKSTLIPHSALHHLICQMPDGSQQDSLIGRCLDYYPKPGDDDYESYSEPRVVYSADGSVGYRKGGVHDRVRDNSSWEVTRLVPIEAHAALREMKGKAEGESGGQGAGDA